MHKIVYMKVLKKIFLFFILLTLSSATIKCGKDLSIPIELQDKKLEYSIFQLEKNTNATLNVSIEANNILLSSPNIDEKKFPLLTEYIYSSDNIQQLIQGERSFLIELILYSPNDFIIETGEKTYSLSIIIDKIKLLQKNVENSFGFLFFFDYHDKNNIQFSMFHAFGEVGNAPKKENYVRISDLNEIPYFFLNK